MASNAFSRSWSLFKSGLSICQSHPKLIWLQAAFAGFGMIYFLLVQLPIAFFGGYIYKVVLAGESNLPAWVDRPYNTYIFWPIFAVSLIVWIYLTVSTGIASYHGVKQALNGGHVSIRECLAFAWERRRQAMSWSLLSAAVTGLRYLFQELIEKFTGGLAAPLFAKILVWLGFAAADTAWGFATVFVIPVIAEEGVYPAEAVKRSADTFGKTWMGKMITDATAGTIIGLVALLGYVIIMAGGMALALEVFSGSATIITVAITGFLVLGYTLACVGVANVISATYNSVLYRYATTGDVVGPFMSEYIVNAYKPAPEKKMFGVRMP